jgi:hypothetical protein
MPGDKFPRPVVTTWDAFDTLIARHVPDPLIAAKLTQQKLGVGDFLDRRLAAQAALDKLGKPYVLSAIYRQMIDAGMDPALARRGETLETLHEHRQMFPIARNVQRVDPHDLIVSDMYLAPEAIETFLHDACDLHMLRPIVRSNWGKATGTIWPHLQRHYVVRRHVGDNPVSDVAVPQRFGIACELVEDSKPTAWERKLGGMGLSQLALLQREVRLRSIPMAANAFHDAAVGPYLTLLAAFAVFLRARHGAETDYVFLSRSADDARRVFAALFPDARARSLDISRRLAFDPDTAALLAGKLGPDSLAIDICGTGRSFFAATEDRATANRGLQLLVFLSRLVRPENAQTTEARRRDGRLTHVCALDAGSTMVLEQMFQSHYPPVGRLAEDVASGGLVRRYGESEYDREELALLAWKSATLTQFLRVVRNRGFDPRAIRQPVAVIETAIRQILAMPQIARCFASFVAREKFDET